MLGFLRIALVLLSLGCASAPGVTDTGVPEQRPYALVLGIAQDAGYPQAGCGKECCQAALADPGLRRFAVCLAIVDPLSGERWLLDCSPDFRDQLALLDAIAPGPPASGVAPPALTGILLTHAHIGHYAGLLQLGHEVMGARGVPVYAMPRMRGFLEGQGPWDQLVRFGNVELRDLADGRSLWLNERIRVTPFLVPHRDEYSETVGFRVDGPQRSIVYLPDIDKWERFGTPIEDLVRGVDVAYLDGCFFGDGELPGRDMSVIQHPFVEETIERFADQPAEVRGRVRFLHLNHTNPVLRGTAEREAVAAAGMRVAEQGEWVGL